MAKGHEQIAEALNEKVQFPWHGVAKFSDGSATLVFPFLRAIWELRQHNQELERGRKIKWRDVFIASNFQDRWNRVHAVVQKLTHLETTVLGDDHGFEYIASHQEFPLWLDLFHFYLPMLLDVTVVALGLILSDAPSSFPRQFKGLFKEGLDVDGMKLRCTEDDFLEMIEKNRYWYDQIRPSQGKSIRDSIVHRLSKWQIVTRTADDNEEITKLINAQLYGTDSDITSDDGLIEAKRMLDGFCSFLSSLPHETWISNVFETRDLITAKDAKQIGGRFLPILSDTLE